MFKRKLESQLIEWKNSDVHKPLIVRGARQVGKTSLIRNFGTKNFSNVVEINLEKETHKQMFNSVMSVEDLEKRINLGLNQTISAGKTLIFIDEIQESQRMLELLRFMAEERQSWHVLVAGSLLEVKLGKDWKIPVGRVGYKYLYPLTFFEYLEAMGKTNLLNELNNVSFGKTVGGSLFLEDEFRQYILLGGMPEVIANFSKYKDYGKVREILARIQTTYGEDVGKYLKSDEERKYLEAVIEDGPRIAGSIFNYQNFAGSTYKSREMSDAVRKIERTMLCTQLPAINSTVLPIVYKYKRPKKMIWLDVGIVNLVNNAYPELIKGLYGGRLMEQIIGQTLIATMFDGLSKLSYYAKDKDKGSAEVDFCFPWRGRLVGIEVKSGNTFKSRSLTKMREEAKENLIPVMMTWNKFGIKNGVYNIPFYLAERWEEFLTV